VSLVIQAVGGGMAATASDSNGENLGSYIMLAGIVFQLVAIVVYAMCEIQYYLPYSKNSPITSYSNKKSNSNTTLRGTFTKFLKYMTNALIFMTTCLFIHYVWTPSRLSIISSPCDMTRTLDMFSLFKYHDRTSDMYIRINRSQWK